MDEHRDACTLPRRAALLGLAALMAGAGTGQAAEATAWGFSFPAIEGGTLALSAYKGQVLLVVNTASFCGYTYQYEALQKLHAAQQKAGLVVVGVPSQDFNQESASNDKVKDFCEATFGIDFPMAGLSHVRGPAADPFYRWVKAETGWQPEWNFNKVLIGRNGRIIAHYPSGDEPQGARLTQAIGAALALA